MIVRDKFCGQGVRLNRLAKEKGVKRRIKEKKGGRRKTEKRIKRRKKWYTL